MIFRYNVHAGRALRNDVFRWHVDRDQETIRRDLTWDFAEPDEYPALVAKQKPGLMASKREKAFHTAVASADPAEMLLVAEQEPKYAGPAQAIAGLLLLETNLDQGISLLSEVVSSSSEVSKDHFIRKYLPEAGLSVVIAAGLLVRLPLQRNSIVLLLAELHQARGFADQALVLLEGAEPTTHIRLSRTELLYEAERFEDVVAATDGVINDDDFTALMLAYRGRSLGELGRDDEAISTYARVLESPNRADAVKAIALVGRGMINQARGELILAENDFTQALIEVPNDQEARKHIQELIRSTGSER
jgi:tetratricopeptide (TPR) repeat protein